MCTAATYKTRDFYFGRTLDYEFSYGDEVLVMPRNFPLHFRHQDSQPTHYAIIGMGCVMEDTPLYYDAVNEKGLCIAGLNFVGNARCHPYAEGKANVATFELIPWLLGQCATVEEAKGLLADLNLLDVPFRPQIPVPQLHWIIADKTQAITLESVESGVMIYDNPVGVLTNNPPFPLQMFNLNNYRHLSPAIGENRFGPGLELAEYSRGMGGLGLPGDLSSQSRFVRVAFTKMNALSQPDETSSVSQFFHILNSVDQQRGCCKLDEGVYEITLYTSCCNADRGIYYYTTYDNHQISAVDMHRENLDGSTIARYPTVKEEQISFQN